MTTNSKYRQIEWTPEKITRFWDYVSQFPDVFFANQFGDRIVARLRPWLQGRAKVLDYGCGTGSLIPHLAQLGGEVTGVDLSVDSIAVSNTRHKDVPNFRGAVLPAALAAADGRFDGIVCVEVVEHLDDVSLETVLKDIFRLLAPGGVAIFTTPNEEDLQASMIYCPEGDVVFHRWQHMRNWSAATLSTAVARYGFVTEAAFTTDFAHRPLRRPVETLKRIAKRVLRIPLPHPHLVCVARKPA
jgi:2-polyprenyl-3-methyl-5-hydroxy-6-metoxy-1,4-benzoquinol methylase